MGMELGEACPIEVKPMESRLGGGDALQAGGEHVEISCIDSGCAKKTLNLLQKIKPRERKLGKLVFRRKERVSPMLDGSEMESSTREGKAGTSGVARRVASSR